eukprot:TRINITY_DN4020_c1_g3_i1.p1 TRINITY_DN4020_c1_g3~~TRINITY_DN4020_c1_g3_i1.p1  ORF type:complete len:410 (-),score=87.33 TRINITY_DN4020_c1_g3_i1:6-1235(-)
MGFLFQDNESETKYYESRHPGSARCFLVRVFDFSSENIGWTLIKSVQILEERVGLILLLDRKDWNDELEFNSSKFVQPLTRSLLGEYCEISNIFDYDEILDIALFPPKKRNRFCPKIESNQGSRFISDPSPVSPLRSPINRGFKNYGFGNGRTTSYIKNNISGVLDKYLKKPLSGVSSASFMSLRPSAPKLETIAIQTNKIFNSISPIKNKLFGESQTEENCPKPKKFYPNPLYSPSPVVSGRDSVSDTSNNNCKFKLTTPIPKSSYVNGPVNKTLNDHNSEELTKCAKPIENISDSVNIEETPKLWGLSQRYSDSVNIENENMSEIEGINTPTIIDPMNVNTSSEEIVQNMIDEEDRLCTICMDSKVNAVFIPCGHVATCMDCGKQNLEFCPICRGKIENVFQVYICF